MENCEALIVELFETAALPTKQVPGKKNTVLCLARDTHYIFQWNKADTFNMVDSSFYYHWTNALQFYVLL